MTLEDKLLRYLDLRTKIETFRKEAAEGRVKPDDARINEVGEVVCEFVLLEGELLNALRDADVIDGLVDPRSRAVIADLKRKIREQAFERMEEDPFDMSPEEEGAAWDAVYDLIGTPKEFILNRQRTESIVALASIPQRICEILDEAKTCYITKQRNAAVALGRIMLEHAVIDVGVRLGQFPEPESVEDFYKIYPPYARADLVLGQDSPARRKFRDLYRAGSQVIHSSHEQGTVDVAKFLEDVVRWIGDIYTANHRALQSVR